MTPSQLRVELSQLPGTIRWGHSVPAPHSSETGFLPTGHPEVDALLGGGVPRGRLSEVVVGRGSAGATSLAQRLLAGVTRAAHLAAWVDVADAFDPASASTQGVELGRVLWVRPPDTTAALAATEILLGTGGFALVLLDAARAAEGAPSGKGHRMLGAAQTWLRLARAAACSQTALVVLRGRLGGSTELAGAAAGMRLELSPIQAVWEGAPGAPPLLEGLVTRVDVARCRGGGGGRQAHIRLV